MGLLFSAFLGGFLFFQSKATPRAAAAAIKTALQAKFPGAIVQVEVEGNRGLDVVNGRFRTVHLHLSHFSIGTACSESNEPSGAAGDTATQPASPAAPDPLAGLAILAVPDARHKGSIGSLTVELTDFAWNGLPIREADLSTSNLVYDLGALKKGSGLAIAASDPATVHIALVASALSSRIASQLSGELHDVSLALQGNRIEITGYKKAPLIGTHIPVLLTAIPEARGAELWAADVHVKIGGLPVPPIISDIYVRRINPVYRLTLDPALPFRLTTSRANVQADALTLDAVFDFLPAGPVKHSFG